MRTIRYDLPLDCDQPPQRGDMMSSTRVVYRVLDAVLVDSPVWDNRWRIQLERVGRIAPDGMYHYDDGLTVRDVAARDARWWDFRPYASGEGPVEFFRDRYNISKISEKS